MTLGRPREFDERDVLEKAMQVFWLRGYEGTSISHLLREMGISRQSLYDTFGNKRELFIRTIHHYRETRLAEALALLEREGSQIENVKAVLDYFRKLGMDARCRGCLVTNALVEVGPHDEEIGELLEETLGMLRAAIQEALKEAQRRGELSRAKSPLQLSRALTNAMIGIAVSGKLRTEPAALRGIYAGTLSMLD